MHLRVNLKIPKSALRWPFVWSFPWFSPLRGIPLLPFVFAPYNASQDMITIECMCFVPRRNSWWFEIVTIKSHARHCGRRTSNPSAVVFFLVPLWYRCMWHYVWTPCGKYALRKQCVGRARKPSNWNRFIVTSKYWFGSAAPKQRVGSWVYFICSWNLHMLWDMVHSRWPFGE